jgi:hypothetical protein
MRVALPTPPFDRESLTALFGFPVPASFVTLLNTLCHDCASAEAAYERTYDSLGWLLAGDDQRYQQTPPELFPIAATGVDGGHFGYAIHAPEVAASDYPIARLEPMDSGGAYLLGTSTFEAVETHISTALLYEQQHGWPSPLSFEWWPEVGTMLRHLGIEPDLAKAQRNDGGGDGRPVVPAILEGWHYIPSSDGIGVLAPEPHFHPALLHSMVDRPNVSLVLEAASRHAADHFPATALWLLRECYWHTWAPSSDDTIALCRAMIDSYHSLGRSSLAAVVDRRIAMLRRR